MYTYSGSRSKEALIEFATGGFKLQEPDGNVPVVIDGGVFSQMMFLIIDAYNNAAKDIMKGNYVTENVVLASLPIIFALITLIVVIITLFTSTDDDIRKVSADNNKKQE